MKKTAFIYVILAGMLWGTSGVFFNLLEPYGFSSLQMTTMRAVISAACMVVYLAIKDRKLLKPKGSELILFLCSGVSIFITASCYFLSIDASSVTTAVILMYTAPVFVMTFSCMFLGERFTLAKGVSVLFVIVGCALVSGVVGGMVISLKGVIFGLISGIAYAAYSIFTKISSMRGANSLTGSLYSFSIMSIIAVFASDTVGIVRTAAASPFTIILIVGIGVCTCFLPYVFYNLALKALPAGTVSAMVIIEPVAASVFSVFMGERLGVPAMVGIVLVLGAVVVLSKSDE